jgi:hypothetical protein
VEQKTATDYVLQELILMELFIEVVLKVFGLIHLYQLQKLVDLQMVLSGVFAILIDVT